MVPEDSVGLRPCFDLGISQTPLIFMPNAALYVNKNHL